MPWNTLKFHIIRAGPKAQLKEDTTILIPYFDHPLIDEDVVRDIGILQQPNLEFGSQVENPEAKPTNKAE